LTTQSSFVLKRTQECNCENGRLVTLTRIADIDSGSRPECLLTEMVKIRMATAARVICRRLVLFSLIAASALLAACSGGSTPAAQLCPGTPQIALEGYTVTTALGPEPAPTLPAGEYSTAASELYFTAASSSIGVSGELVLDGSDGRRSTHRTSERKGSCRVEAAKRSIPVTTPASPDSKRTSRTPSSLRMSATLPTARDPLKRPGQLERTRRR